MVQLQQLKLEHLGFCLWFSSCFDTHGILYIYSVLWSVTNLISVFSGETNWSGD
jgi:hypothetical protein